MSRVPSFYAGPTASAGVAKRADVMTTILTPQISGEWDKPGENLGDTRRAPQSIQQSVTEPPLFSLAKEVDPERGQLTLNLPPPGAGQPLASYRLRLEQVPNIDRCRVAEVVEPVQGMVIRTRLDLLLQQSRQALGEAIDLSQEQLTLPEGLSLPNPLLAYQALLDTFLEVNLSTIHGDLNLENILVDPDTRDVKLIDFATVRQGHALHDLLRLETEVVTKLVPELLVEAKLPPAETIHR